MSSQHASLAHKAAEEFKVMLALAAYLYVGLGAVLLAKTAFRSLGTVLGHGALIRMFFVSSDVTPAVR